MSNISSTANMKDQWQPWEILITSIPMSLLIAEIVLGNLLVLVAVLSQRPLRTPSNIIILSLAVADLAVGVFILPLNIIDMIIGWRLGKVMCRIWLTSDVTLCSTSILHISAIAVDRFRSINEGVAYAQSRTIRMSLIVCGSLWLIALWIASAPVLGWNDWDRSKLNSSSDYMECYLTRDLGYIIHSASGAFFIPAAIMVGLYFRIFLLIRNKLRERAGIICVSKSTNDKTNIDRQDTSSGNMVNDALLNAIKDSSRTPEKSIDENTICDVNNEGKRKKKHSEQIETILKNKLRFSLTKERKAAKTLGIIIGAFIVCWTPFTLCYLTSGIIGNDVPFWLFQLVTWLGYINSGLNPIIYTIYNPEFRKAFAVLLNGVLCRVTTHLK
ncbi:unnamed protein product [Orchesella dallaii]|uniref:G-protein coupled receptors family 1 profile domain-containing protein n=1 Tax=Orchesella dallaii TaxID=48710 RepID=A0ABP1S0Q4_9HEXA